MGLLGKIIVRCIFSISIVILIVSGTPGILSSLYDTFNACALVFGIVSADILIERYLSREVKEQ